MKLLNYITFKVKKIMTTFRQMVGLTGEVARNARVSNMIKTSASASRAFVEQMKQTFRDQQNEIFKHTDMGQTETTSLIIKSDFNPSAWIEELFNKHLALILTSRKINIAVKQHNTLFPEQPVGGLDDDELEFINQIDCDIFDPSDIEDDA